MPASIMNMPIEETYAYRSAKTENLASEIRLPTSRIWIKNQVIPKRTHL
ncbi:hypothetical protein ACFOG5_06020 [Pedobacter fastidiosus]